MQNPTTLCSRCTTAQEHPGNTCHTCVCCWPLSTSSTACICALHMPEPDIGPVPLVVEVPVDPLTVSSRLATLHANSAAHNLAPGALRSGTALCAGACSTPSRRRSACVQRAKEASPVRPTAASCAASLARWSCARDWAASAVLAAAGNWRSGGQGFRLLCSHSLHLLRVGSTCCKDRCTPAPAATVQLNSKGSFCTE